MNQRHRNHLTLTSRLILFLLDRAGTLLSYVDLIAQTGCSKSNLEETTRALVRVGRIVRESSGGMSFFSLPGCGVNADIIPPVEVQ